MSGGENILISVVIPSYNRADTVGETIDSIATQEGIGKEFDVEIVIGDDCSTDNAREVLQQYKEKYPTLIRLLLHEKNMGLGANWATCVMESEGKYICNCDNDDYWHNKQKLRLQLAYMEEHPQANVLLTDYRRHHRETGVIVEEKTYVDKTVTTQDAIMHGKYTICNASIMYRGDFLKSHVNLQDYVKYQFTLQDWNTWFILSADTTFDILPVSTATFGVETESITRPRTYEKLAQRMRKERECVEYLGTLFPKYQLEEGEWDWLTATRLLDLAFHKNDYAAAHKYAKELKQGIFLPHGLSKKAKLAQCRLTFSLWVLAKKIVRLCRKR